MTTETPDPEHVALLAAIGRALGRDAPYEEMTGEREEAIHLGTTQSPPAGKSLTVLGGAVDPETGRVAWVEEQSSEPEARYVHVTLYLHVAQGGEQLGRVEVPTYNPYFGCSVRSMRWFGESLVCVYREKHRSIAARMDPPYSGLELVEVGDGSVVDGGTVYFVSERPGLLEGRMVPSLVSALPLPVPSSPRHVEIWSRAPGTLALALWPPRSGEDDDARIKAARAAARSIPLPPPEDRTLLVAPERLWARLHELLARTEPPRFGVDVLVGSVATPFWHDDACRGTSYGVMRVHRDDPGYLAVYWYEHLMAEGRKAEAQTWLQWLEHVAALESVDPMPWTRELHGEELIARTALAYLRTRAGVLAEVARTGQLPEGESCYFFTGLGQNAPPMESEESYPPGFREVLRHVSSSKPESLSSR